MPEIEAEDLQLACGLFLECYDRHALEKLLRIRFNWKLEQIVREASLIEQVADLFEFAERHRLVSRLLKEAAEFPPPKEKLRPLTAKYPGGAENPIPQLADLVADAIGGFEAVKHRLEDQAVHQRFAPFVGTYRLAAAQIDQLRRYKKLHDGLQLIQMQQREIALAAAAVEVASLLEYADVLTDAVGEVRGVIGGLPNPGAEETWADGLQRAVGLLRSGAEQSSSSLCRQAAHLLERILERDPSRIHGLILRHSEAIPLASLIFSLREVRRTPGNGWQKAIEGGLVAMEALQLRLSALVAEHTAWQNFDNSLRLARKSWYQILAAGDPTQLQESQLEYVDRLVEDWADVWTKLEQVRLQTAAPDRLAGLVAYAEKIQQAATTRGWGVVLDVFEPFAKLALRRFVDVDRRLLVLVEELTRIGEPLQTVVEVIPS